MVQVGPPLGADPSEVGGPPIRGPFQKQHKIWPTHLRFPGKCNKKTLLQRIRRIFGVQTRRGQKLQRSFGAEIISQVHWVQVHSTDKSNLQQNIPLQSPSAEAKSHSVHNTTTFNRRMAHAAHPVLLALLVDDNLNHARNLLIIPPKSSNLATYVFLMSSSSATETSIYVADIF